MNAVASGPANAAAPTSRGATNRNSWLKRHDGDPRDHRREIAIARQRRRIRRQRSGRPIASTTPIAETTTGRDDSTRSIA